MTLVAIVLTLNEEEHLPDCLASLARLTDRVIILDCGSTDATAEIARRTGAEVVTRQFDGYASQRNAALDLVGHAAWVLFLDADERLTDAGVAEIRERLAAVGTDVAAFWFPRRNVFFGRALRGGGWWPDYQARLLRPDRTRYDETRQVHEVVQIDGASAHLLEPIVHRNYATRRELLCKQRHYTHQRVAQEVRLGRVPRRRAYLAAPARELWRRFITLRGYRDRLTGLFLAVVMAYEELRACWLLRRGDASQ